jgi:methenyltetrahydrofolate cyclohydrolase
VREEDAAASETHGLSEHTLQELLTAMAAGRPDPAAGSAAALGTAMGAALVAKAARLSQRHTDDAEAMAAHADELWQRGLHLAEADAAAIAVMGAEVRPASDPGEVAASRPSLDDAITVPTEIRALAEEVVMLADTLHERGNPRLRVDADAARLLAAAAGRVATAIVRSNEDLRRR